MFRPDSRKFDKNGRGVVPKSAAFFRKSDYETEDDQRNEGHKWETVMNRSRRFRASSLHQPAFDIHYVPREGGGVSQDAEPIKYALVATITNSNARDLYDQILREYGTVLQPMQPVVEIPVSVA